MDARAFHDYEGEAPRAGISSYILLIVLSGIFYIVSYASGLLWIVSSSLSLAPAQVGFVFTQVLKVVLQGANLGLGELFGFPDPIVSSRLSVALASVAPSTFFGVTNLFAAAATGYLATRLGLQRGALIVPFVLGGLTYGELTNPFLFKGLHVPLFLLGLLALQVGVTLLMGGLYRALKS